MLVQTTGNMRLSLALMVVLSVASCTVMAAPFERAYSAVVLKLNDGRTAQCILPTAPWLSRNQADMVSSHLVASGKMTCKSAQEHASHDGKTLHCEAGQLGSTDDAITTLKSACHQHHGTHAVV